MISLKCIKLELGVQAYVQRGKNPLTHLNRCHKITHEDIVQLVELHEIVHRLKQGKYGSKPQHDLYMRKELKVHFFLFIIRAINDHLH
jgi:hypothetical protein